MTGLLVSVRDAEEARDALAAGAELIDVKEPDHGSLGPAQESVVRDVVRTISSQVPVSMALGEFMEGGAEWNPVAPGVEFVKLGLAGCAGQPEWQVRAHDALRQAANGCQRVAVCYADWQTAGAPNPQAVIDWAESSGCTALLLDTYDKTLGHLLDHFSEAQLRELSNASRRKGMWLVLAGSLTSELIPHVMCVAPDYVAVRGAVCSGKRTGRIVGKKVSRLARLLRKLHD